MGRLFNFIFHWIVAKHWHPNRSIVPGIVKLWNLYLIGSQLIEIEKKNFDPAGQDALWPLITQKVTGRICSNKSQNVSIYQGYRSGKFRNDRLKTHPSRTKKHVFWLIFSRFAKFSVRRSFDVNNSASFEPILFKQVSKCCYRSRLSIWKFS